MSVSILVGDCRDLLRTIPEKSIHSVVTSPPYWGLRDYDADGQIGLEADFDTWLTEMVQVFDEIWRVLRDDGTLWVNMGDAYVSGQGGRQSSCGELPPTLRRDRPDPRKRTDVDVTGWGERAVAPRNYPSHESGLKPKDLYGQPWELALALRRAGWWLRQDIIWHKPNPMPESVTDRCTKAHEYIFLLSKGPRYYYDADAIREPHDTAGERHEGKSGYRGDHPSKGGIKSRQLHPNGRNKRSVWSVPIAPFSEAHFATFPPALIEPCIKAGCPEGGTVLDPFGGAGTTGLVADRLGRNAILMELNPEYADMAEKRIHGDQPLFAQVVREPVE